MRVQNCGFLIGEHLFELSVRCGDGVAEPDERNRQRTVMKNALAITLLPLFVALFPVGGRDDIGGKGLGQVFSVIDDGVRDAVHLRIPGIDAENDFFHARLRLPRFLRNRSVIVQTMPIRI